jgi:hypothetical protein
VRKLATQYSRPFQRDVDQARFAHVLHELGHLCSSSPTVDLPLFLRPVVDRQVFLCGALPECSSPIDEHCRDRADRWAAWRFGSHRLSFSILALRQALASQESGEGQLEWLCHEEALERFLRRLVSLGRRADTARQSRAASTAAGREERAVSRATSPPGRLVVELRRPPRGPGVSPVEQGVFSLASGGMVRAAA